MKKRILKPEQVTVPGEYELGNESILNIYFKVFNSGQGKVLPPVIVTTIGSFNALESKYEDVLKRWEKTEPDGIAARRKDFRTLVEVINRQPYLLIDGNHKTAAATLTHQGINALEIESNEDFHEIERMLKCGELFEFNPDQRDLTELRESFVAYCLGLERERLDGFCPTNRPLIRYTKNVRQRVEDLILEDYFPEYMKDRYLKGK